MLVADKESIIEIDGAGNVLTHDWFRAIGSGGLYAECAAEALYDMEAIDALLIAQKSMQIAASKCIYTNSNFIIKTLEE